MDERTREGLNFLLTATIVLALFALLSTLMLPSWLHGSVIYVAVVVLAALGVAHGLLERGIVQAWGLEPLPPRTDGQESSEEYSTDGDDVTGATPKERVEKRRARE